MTDQLNFKLKLVFLKETNSDEIFQHLSTLKNLTEKALDEIYSEVDFKYKVKRVDFEKMTGTEFQSMIFCF